MNASNFHYVLMGIILIGIVLGGIYLARHDTADRRKRD